MGLVECCNVSIMFLLVYLYDCPMNSEPNTQNKNKNLSWDGNSWIGREGLSTPPPLISCIHGNRMGGILLGWGGFFDFGRKGNFPNYHEITYREKHPYKTVVLKLYQHKKK